MKASEVIREARNVLFERGWHQGSLRGPDGSLCIVGAVTAVRGFDTKRADHNVGLMSALQHSTGAHFIIGWNDEPDRVFGDVIDALDRAEKFALIAEESDV